MRPRLGVTNKEVGMDECTLDFALKLRLYYPFHSHIIGLVVV
jgi:hypothetical protein